MSGDSNPFLDSPFTPIGVHVMWGIICLGLMGQPGLPVLTMLYAALGGHVVWVHVIKSHDVTYRIPQTYPVVVCGAIEFVFTCFKVTQHSSTGLLVVESMIIAVLQIAIHLAYLMLSPTAVIHHISLGEKGGSAKKMEQD